MDSSFASPVGKEIAAISAKQRVTVDRYLTDSRPILHRQSTDTLATVDRNISAEVSAECRPTYRPIVSTDGLLTKTTCRPTLDRHIGRVSVDISAECRSPYRPIVSTDTQPTDALSTHDPKSLSFDSNPSCEISRESPGNPPFNVSVSAFTKLPPVFAFGAISPIAPLSVFRAPTCSSGESSGIVDRLMASSRPKRPLEISE